MKHIRYIAPVFIACFALLCPLHAENDLTEAEMDSLAMMFYSWEKGSGDEEMISQPILNSNTNRAYENFTQSHEYSIEQDYNNLTYIDKILIIVKYNVFTEMPSYILRYAHDIHNTFGCAVNIVSVNGESASQIRNLLQSYSSNLNGAVLIGDIMHADFYHPDSPANGKTVWYAEKFPCDLYYMDLDGSWSHTGGAIDTLIAHTGGTGDVEPEIFVGRINTAGMGRTEIQELKWYFDKNHQYYTGKNVLNKQRALTFTGADWDAWWREFRGGVSPLYGSNYYDAVYGSSYFTKANYCSYLQNSTYEFIQLASHSNVQVHNFPTTADSLMYPEEIYVLGTKQIGYNLFCCKACNWTKMYNSPCIGESYLYGLNNNSSALALAGSTKTGGMLGLKNFYNPLGNGKCIGQAFKEWWINQWGNNHNNYAIHWAYGMVILGDPLVNFNFTNDCDDNLYLNSGEETTNNMFYAQSKIVVQNYAMTQGQSVTLSAPTIEINGPFVCNSSSSFLATPNDNCVCNTRTTHRIANSHISNNSGASSNEGSKITLSVYPNPVKDILTIDTNEEIATIAIYNQSGQCVLLPSKTIINVSNFPQGLYVILITTKEGLSIQRKIIKQ